MKPFDRYSIRGIIFSTLGLLGMGYELIFSQRGELFIILLYGVIVFIGLMLIFRIREYKE